MSQLYQVARSGRPEPGPTLSRTVLPTSAAAARIGYGAPREPPAGRVDRMLTDLRCFLTALGLPPQPWRIALCIVHVGRRHLYQAAMPCHSTGPSTLTDNRRCSTCTRHVSNAPAGRLAPAEGDRTCHQVNGQVDTRQGCAPRTERESCSESAVGASWNRYQRQDNSRPNVGVHVRDASAILRAWHGSSGRCFCVAQHVRNCEREPERQPQEARH